MVAVKIGQKNFPPFQVGDTIQKLYLIAVALSSYKEFAYILMTFENEVNLRKKHDRKPYAGCRMQNKTILIGKLATALQW